MRRLLVALVVALAVLAASSTTAFADGSVPVQAATQSADTSQAALAASSATQVQPSNQNISVRVLSPGDDGAVTQSNDASSSATATNSADTKQSADQSAGSLCGCHVPSWSAPTSSAPTGGSSPASGGSGGTSQGNGASSAGNADNTAPTAQDAAQSSGGGGGGGVQASKQDASTEQAALAGSSATQVKPSNSNISVRVLSPGDNGSVKQSNSASSEANASNDADTHQSASQDQGGGSGIQAATQKADTDQTAIGLSSAKQIEPSNSNLSVRVLSKGDDGKVKQSNDVSSEANASNDADTKQKVDQDQHGSSCGCHGSDGLALQVAGQESSTEQGALALSSAEQKGAENSNKPVRVWSKGDGGDVTQSNDVSSSADASNDADTSQRADQDQHGGKCGCESGLGIQALGQSSSTEQLAGAASSAKQVGAENENAPVRIWSKGDDGKVKQSNDVSSDADASNDADTRQHADQDQSGSGIQALGQESETEQGAFALSSAEQVPGREKEKCGCGDSFGNSAGPIRIGSEGDNGSLEQSNSVSSSADASNDADTKQKADQDASGSCKCGGFGIQVLGQKAKTEQLSVALSSAKQIGASNSSSPVRIWSKGKGGHTKQSNDASSDSSSSNDASTKQHGHQLLI
jgi:hypothetical protein